VAHYDVLPDRSTVWIDATSSVHPVHSELHGVTGFIDVDVTGSGALDFSTAPSGRLELPVDRMSSGNPLYDHEMKRRVQADKFPTIIGELTSMAPTPSSGGRSYRVRGDVTLMGVTVGYEGLMSIVAKEDLVVLEGHHTFDIRDFGVEPPRILMLKVHPDFAVRVEIAARRVD